MRSEASEQHNNGHLGVHDYFLTLKILSVVLFDPRLQPDSFLTLFHI